MCDIDVLACIIFVGAAKAVSERFISSLHIKHKSANRKVREATNILIWAKRRFELYTLLNPGCSNRVRIKLSTTAEG